MEKWWPHVGTYGVERMLPGLTRSQIKSKATKMGLVLLSKQERLCIDCHEGHQYERYAGLRCRKCHLARRKKVRKRPQTLEEWIALLTNTARHRSQVPSDLDTSYMLDLWHKQEGKCYYSGLDLHVHKYGDKRRPLSPSIDRVDSQKGYIKGNVVWSAWICNAGKSTLSVQGYIQICRMVCEKWNA